MTILIVTTVAVIGLFGAVIGARHLYFRLDRPGGFECSLRVTHGQVLGLGPVFRAGYAGPEMQILLWRRIAWPGEGVRIPVLCIRIDQARRPAPGERLRIPATFSVMPIELADGTTLELALPRRRVARLVALLS